MSVWAAKRQATYLFGIILLLLIIVGIPAFLATRTAPTCADGAQNQDEAGVDCGGSCTLLCPFQIPAPIIHWARAFKVADGVYNTVAFIENAALDIGTERIGYSFKLYDSRNILIAERTGATFLPPKRLMPIFEGAIQTGERIPVRTFFEFIGVSPWTRVPPEEDALVVRDSILRDEATAPRLSATLHNVSVRTVRDIEVVAIVYDAADNAVAASKTVIDALEKDRIVALVFTWFEPFSSPAVRTEIIPRVKPEPNR